MAFENPFKPAAGKQPPILLGREEPIEEFIEGIAGGAGAAGRLMRISGALGTGKTVLLKRLCNIAENQGWHVVRKLADENVRVSSATLNEMTSATAGYPFMVQLVGHESWAASRDEYGIVEEISPDAARRGIARAVKKFEERVIEPALDSLAPNDLAYLLKLHELGGTADSRAVAAALGFSINQASPRRSHLINDGLIEAPSHGQVSISMPYLGAYLDQHPDLIG